MITASNPEKALRYVLGAGLWLGAGDIHIEPEENSVKIRYRIDGILQDVAEIPMNEYPHFLGNIKVLSGFKATDVEQGVKDSRFGIHLDEGSLDDVKDREVDVRVSIILGGYGETVVMRLLNQSAQALDLEKLGIRKQNLEKILKAIQKAERHHSQHRPDRFRKNNHPLFSAFHSQQTGRENHHRRRPD